MRASRNITPRGAPGHNRSFIGGRRRSRPHLYPSLAAGSHGARRRRRHGWSDRMRYIPDAARHVERSVDHMAAIRAEANVADFPSVPGEKHERRAGRRVPNARRTVIRGCRNPFPVWAETREHDGPGGPGKRQEMGASVGTAHTITFKIFPPS
jgi:hypothetical protein